MFNYNVDWERIVGENIPAFFQWLFRLNWIYALIKPFKNIHSEFLLIKDDSIEKAAYTFQKIYLEKLLNDKFDLLRRIYITDDFTFNDHYLYENSESKPPRYLYKKWNATITYGVGIYVVDGNLVYVSNIGSTNIQPLTDPVTWTMVRSVDFLRKKIEFSTLNGFVINIPAVLIYDEVLLRGLVDYYRYAAVQYTIVTF